MTCPRPSPAHALLRLLAAVCASCVALSTGLAQAAKPAEGDAGARAIEHVAAVALDGEGAYALLRRFELPRDGCHLAQFYELNGLSAKQALQRDREYKLPLLRYTYDGRSIRSTIGRDDWTLAKAIQTYNRSRETAGQQAAAYETSRELWVPYGLLHCPDAAAAPAERKDEPADGEGATRTASGYAIFGPTYAQVEQIDDRLAGRHYYLIAGHGGPDPGAMAKIREHRICEDEYAYDVLLRLARNILSHGGVPYVIVRDPDDGIRDEVYLECDYDEVAWGDEPIPRDQLERLRQRTAAVNELARRAKARGVKEQYCIEIHVDSRHAERQTDLYFYHQRKSDDSEDTAECIREAMARNYAKHGRSRAYEGTIRARDLFTLREAKVPTIYIEIGNIQHSFDQQRVLKVSNRQALADWFAEGLLDRAAEIARR